jgi:hypothetical protein
LALLRHVALGWAQLAKFAKNMLWTCDARDYLLVPGVNKIGLTD